jgi:hypothetical protein
MRWKMGWMVKGGEDRVQVRVSLIVITAPYGEDGYSSVHRFECESGRMECNQLLLLVICVECDGVSLTCGE